jgi:GNAT superfamily N-acetyltransferase
MGPPPAPPEPGLPAAGAPTAAEFEAAATRPADVGRMAPAEARADFEQRRATRTQGQPPTPGQQFAESQGYDWAKLSPDDRLALEQIAEAQANMAAQNLEVPPRPAAPPAPAEPRTLADLIPETELERQLGESIRQAQAGKPTAAEVPPQPAAPVQKAENIFAKNARLAKAVRVADAAQEAGLKSGDIFRMSPAEFAEKVGEKSISADTMAMVVDKLRRLESQAPPAAPAPAPAPTGPKSTPPSAAPTTLRDLMQPEPPAAAAPRKLPSDARVTFKPDPEDAGTWNVKATIGNESIGSMDLIERPNDLEVDLSHLLPKYRGQGYGKVMYQEALKKAQELGKRRLISGSEFTEDAARVWRSLGGEEFTDAHGETRWRLAVPAEPKAAAPRPRRAKPTR